MCTHHWHFQPLWKYLDGSSLRSPQSVFQTPSKTDSPPRRGGGSTRMRQSSRRCPAGSSARPRWRCQRTWWSSIWEDQNWFWVKGIKERVCWMWKYLSLFSYMIQVLLTHGPRRSPWPGWHSPRVPRRGGRSQLGPGCGGTFSGCFEQKSSELPWIQRGFPTS